MKDFYFSLQLFGDVVHGYASDDNYAAPGDNMQIYGLAGNDSIQSMGHSGNLLIGGSGNDVLHLVAGSGTLAGGTGNDTFVLTYAQGKPINAVIEDVDPANDSIAIFYDGADAPQFYNKVEGNDVLWTDSTGNFSLVLKGVNEAKDYFDGNADEKIWEVLKLTNAEREKAGRSPLTLMQHLTDGAAVRAQEITQAFGHGRTNGTNFDTVLNGYYNLPGENIAAGNATAAETVNQWMNSAGHRANILDSNNIGYTHLGVGYNYSDASYYKHYWVQLFSAAMTNPEVRSTAELLQAKMNISNQGGTIGGNTGGGGTGGGGTVVDDGRLTAVQAGNGRSVYQYYGGNKYIPDYAPNGMLQYNTAYSGYGLSGNDFVVYSPSGTLNIQNARDRLIEATDSSGNTVGYAYMAGSGQTVDGRSLAVPVSQVIIGSNGAEDVLIAGNGGASLWGGTEFVTDTMYGGEGKDTFVITSKTGHDIVDWYGAGDTLRFYDNSVLGGGPSGNDLVLNGVESSVTVKDCRDRVIEVTDANGNLIGRAYMSSIGGNIDGRNVSGYQAIVGGDNASNVIAAGNDGSMLWGGLGAADTLVGGNGADSFIFGANDGNDYILNSGAGDTLSFYSPMAFTSAYMSGEDLVITAGTDSITINKWSPNGMNTFTLSDGSKYRLTQGSNNAINYQRIS